MCVCVREFKRRFMNRTIKFQFRKKRKRKKKFYSLTSLAILVVPVRERLFSIHKFQQARGRTFPQVRACFLSHSYHRNIFIAFNIFYDRHTCHWDNVCTSHSRTVLCRCRVRGGYVKGKEKGLSRQRMKLEDFDAFLKNFCRT